MQLWLLPKKGKFVGYDKGSPAYLVYHPEMKVVKRHRVVKFTDSVVAQPNVPAQIRISDADDDFDVTENSNLRCNGTSQNDDNNGKLPEQLPE